MSYEKLEQLYEGKAKKVFATSDPNVVIVSYKDDATAFNGLKKGTITGKGAINNRMTNNLMRRLEEKGVPTHYVEELSDRETAVKKVSIVPLEVIIRNISAGSFAKRFGVEEGIVFDAPTIEFSYKNDDLGDPLMNSYHALALKLATQEEIDLIKKYAFAVNDLLRGFMKKIGIDLVDFKLEFGKTSDGTIVLADEISPDTCRLWDEQTHEKLDKDRFRRDMGGAEEAYEEVGTRSWGTAGRLAVLPALFDTKRGYKILVSESSLTDYPCLFLTGDGANGMRGVFPKMPLRTEETGDRSVRILEEAGCIAATTGERAFPWRYFVLADEDGDLVETTMTARLAEPCALGDTSWIEPGQVSWEFWNAASPYGPDVDFVAGFNTATYKYFIDFAARFGIPYIIMDEGWAEDTRDPYTPNPEVDLHELIRYGEERGVGVILWLTWLTVEKHFDLFERLSEWGVRGVKIDFMDRSDQWMVNYYERVAAEAARHRMVVAFHGAFKPAGLEYKYPNVLAYEGVRGMENMGGCTPANSLWLPFIRNAVGPMDYTPGAMISMQPEAYCGNRPNAASIGTRAYQMALFVLFETGLQMLADNPTLYYREEECTRFISQVPVTWDETRALRAEAGKHVVVAKRKGAKWYLGAIRAGDDPQDAEFEIPLDFLAGDRDYRMTSFEDGINAFRQAMDYRKKERQVRRGDTIAVRMARNGGWTAVIE